MWPEICYWHCKCFHVGWALAVSVEEVHHELSHVSVAQCLTWKPHLCAVDWCDFLRALLLLAKCELTRKNHSVWQVTPITGILVPFFRRCFCLPLFLLVATQHLPVTQLQFVQPCLLTALACTLEAGGARETPQKDRINTVDIASYYTTILSYIEIQRWRTSCLQTEILGNAAGGSRKGGDSMSQTHQTNTSEIPLDGFLKSAFAYTPWHVAYWHIFVFHQ